MTDQTNPGQISVYATVQQAGIHRWPDAPDSVFYLRSDHRHIFHVCAEVRVGSCEREVEFIALKRDIEKMLASYRTGGDCEFGTMSCEQIALAVQRYLVRAGYNVSTVSVSEDGENGACIRWLHTVPV